MLVFTEDADGVNDNFIDQDALLGFSPRAEGNEGRFDLIPTLRLRF